MAPGFYRVAMKNWRREMKFCTAALLALLTWPVRADNAGSEQIRLWPSDFVARVEALSLLETLSADLLSHDSATLTLEHWCAVHRLAMPAKITAERLRDIDKIPSREQRQELRVSSSETIRYRRVRLVCGSVVLSEADNWYVPSRLSPDMNRSLETTDVPFGKVVLALHYNRHTLSSKLLWAPLPEGWEMNAVPNYSSSEPLRVPDDVLENRAVLSLPDGTPFSEVVETYKSGILAFPAPRP
jgi:chorismate-pyruvate lyase